MFIHKSIDMVKTRCNIELGNDSMYKPQNGKANKGNNKITEHIAIFQRESQNS